MENILIFDTSFASSNKGDDIIMECTRKELAPLLQDNFEINLPTQIPPFHWYQVLKSSTTYRKFADCKWKFVGGSNVMVPNLFTHYAQWNINLFNYQANKGCIMVGVGAGAGAEKGSNWYTRYIYQHMLNREYFHSARDERSKAYMESLGLKAINTGCVTMWMLTPEHCVQIPTRKADKVVFTLTAYNKDENDQVLIDTLQKNYSEIYFWPQSIGDYKYLQSLENIDGIHILQASKEAYDHFLTENDTDYVGTRLHGGVYAMRHKRRAIIVAIDERARAINERNHLNCIEKADMPQLSDMINSEIKTNITIPFDEIKRWKAQFGL